MPIAHTLSDSGGQLSKSIIAMPGHPGRDSADREVPQLDGLVVGARDNEVVAELKTRDSVRVVA